MSIPTHNSKFLSLTIILIAFVIFVFFTRDFYNTMQDLNYQYEQNQKISQSQTTEFERLNTISKKLKETNGQLANTLQIDKYLTPISEDKILANISLFTKNVQAERGRIIIQNISISEGVKNDFGFMESKITIQAQMTTLLVLTDLLDFFISNKEYKFFITDINIPTTTRGYFSVSIPLTLYHTPVDTPAIGTGTGTIATIQKK